MLSITFKNPKMLIGTAIYIAIGAGLTIAGSFGGGVFYILSTCFISMAEPRRKKVNDRYWNEQKRLWKETQ